ncbi:CapA family protein [Natronoglomus mannanivorans]|uniref:CapA family protein n=1 Tax=Natronoglomus mannanivorans TaxID=2979990 RepID=A0AAP2Z1P0_9EURY|nr:CapA family protein [Halobacteria archaeon AArc-xg1-1]
MSVETLTEKEPSETSVQLLAVGDIMPGAAYFSPLVDENSTLNTIMEEPKQIVEENVLQSFEGGDVVFGNLECVISDDIMNNDLGVPKRMVAPPETLDFIEECGFDILNLNNNHILDYGSSLVAATQNQLESHNINHIGNPLRKEIPITITTKGLDIHFIGYNLCEEGNTADESEIFKTLDELSSVAGMVVVSVHWGWGYEHTLKPAPSQINLGHKLIDGGADIVLGHHSHTFQPVEKYNDGVIAYSLGNFLFDMWRDENIESGILGIKIAVENEPKEGKIEGVNVIPISQKNGMIDKTTSSRISNSVIYGSPQNNSEKEYRIYAEKIKQKHRCDVVQQYIRNFHKFPLEFHLSTLSQWFAKISTNKLGDE